jgi:type IV pilus assembly protein PilE
MYMQTTSPARPQQARRSAGFTLIELMISIVIVSVLTAVAIPSYKTFIRKGYRASAQAAMMDIANREEQFLLANRAYADRAAIVASGFGLPADVARAYTFDIAVDNGAVPTFLISFTAIGEQLSDGNLTLNSAGVKGPAGKW